jgi:hypothetical protein
MRQLLAWLGVIGSVVGAIWLISWLGTTEVWPYTRTVILWAVITVLIYTVTYLILDCCKIDLWEQIRRFLDWTAEAEWDIQAHDTPTRARLKLLYLVPVTLAFLPVWLVLICCREAYVYLSATVQDTWTVLLKGKL